ncbi:hypothetical protein ACFL1Z_05395, partial [Thermodesulfobacteriota bacterium]
EIAIEKGFITKDQLVNAFEIQVSDALEQKKRRLIGSILFDLGYINHQRIDIVLRELTKDLK